MEEALRKLDEAVQALKAAGYVFEVHMIREACIVGTTKDYSERTIAIFCRKRISGNDDKNELRKLESFSKDPPEMLSKRQRALLGLGQLFE